MTNGNFLTMFKKNLLCKSIVVNIAAVLAMTGFAQSTNESEEDGLRMVVHPTNTQSNSSPLQGSGERTRSAEVDDALALLRDSQVRYGKYSNAELSEELNEISSMGPERRRALLLEVQLRIRRDGHEAFVNGERRYGRVAVGLDDVPQIKDQRVIPIEEVAMEVDENKSRESTTNRTKDRDDPTTSVPFERAYSQ